MVKKNFGVRWNEKRLEENGEIIVYNYGLEELKRLQDYLKEEKIMIFVPEGIKVDFEDYKSLLWPEIESFEMNQRSFKSCTLEGRLSPDYKDKTAKVFIFNSYVILPKPLLTYDEDDIGEYLAIGVLKGYVEANIYGKEEFDQFYSSLRSIIKKFANKNMVNLRPIKQQRKLEYYTN